MKTKSIKKMKALGLNPTINANKINELIDRLSGLEKGLENVEERTVKLEKRMGEHDYFHSKQPKEDTKELREKIMKLIQHIKQRKRLSLY